MISFIPKAITILVCNDIPKVRNPKDNAFWGRIRVCSFESCFAAEKDVPANIDDQIEKKMFPKDDNIMSKLLPLNDAFCWYLIEHWNNNVKGVKDLDTPKCVLDDTAKYRESNNLLIMFKSEELEACPNAEIPFSQFFTRFCEFIKSKSNKFNITTPLICDFLEDVRCCGFMVNNNNCVEGYKFRSIF
jgi:phage/plasmid-associated DNA primase